MYGHVEKLAEEIKKGAASVEGVDAQLWQVQIHFLHYLRFNVLYYITRKAKTYVYVLRLRCLRRLI